MHLSAATWLNSLHTALPPTLTESAASEFDSLLEWTQAAILSDPSQLGEYPTPGQDAGSFPPTPQTILTPAIRQAHLLVEEGGLGLPSAVDISGPAFIVGQVHILARAMVATNNPGLSRAPSNLADTPHAKALCVVLRKLITFSSDFKLLRLLAPPGRPCP